MLNVLIVEPHDIARAGLRQILKDSRLARQIEAVPDLHNTNQDLLAEREWDVMLFSVESATGDEFLTIKAVRQQHARLAVLALGRHPEALLAVRALKAGASGYLPMDASQPQLLAAVNAISKGKKYLPSDLVEVLADNLNVDWDKPRHDVLSDREAHDYLRLRPGTLARMRMERRGPAWSYVGRRVVYLRVDLLQWDGDWVVSELELIEPGLYLDVSPANAGPYADLLSARLPVR